jgi:cystathionine beta-lyase/cystathionine gamma-synthase
LSTNIDFDLYSGLDDGLIRISVGIERASDLVEDLKSSLDRVMETEAEQHVA